MIKKLLQLQRYRLLSHILWGKKGRHYIEKYLSSKAEMDQSQKSFPLKDSHTLRIAIAEGGGLGDAIMQTLYIKEIRKLFTGKIVIDFYCRAFPAFKNFPFIDNCFPYTDNHPSSNYDVYIVSRRFYIILACDEKKVKKFSKKFLLFCKWCKHLTDDILDGEYNDNLFSQYALLFGKNRLEQANVHNILPITRHTKTYCDLDEESFGILDEYGLTTTPYITVSRSVDCKYNGNHPKLWPLDYYEDLVGHLKKRFPYIKFVQLGAEFGYGRINGIDLNLVGKTSLNQVKILLKYALLHIDGEGGLVHLRHILNGVSAVFFGPTNPKIFGYENNLNFRSAGCVNPCEWVTRTWTNGCLRGFKKPLCMQNLTPDAVFTSIVSYLEKIKLYIYESQYEQTLSKIEKSTIAFLGMPGQTDIQWAKGNSLIIYTPDLTLRSNCDLFHQGQKKDFFAEYASPYNIPSENNYYDMVYINQLEQCRHPFYALQEALRILKPGCYLLVEIKTQLILDAVNKICTNKQDLKYGLLKITKKDYK